jgi:hypothetical protein
MNRLLLAVILAFVLLIFGCIFSNSDYEKNIIIDKYMLTKNQVADLFLDLPIEQKPYKELVNKKVFIVLHLTNTGNNGAWGELLFTIDNRFKDTVNIKLLGPGRRNSAIIVLPYSGVLNPNNREDPDIDVTWTKLSSK